MSDEIEYPREFADRIYLRSLKLLPFDRLSR